MRELSGRFELSHSPLEQASLGVVVDQGQRAAVGVEGVVVATEAA